MLTYPENLKLRSNEVTIGEKNPLSDPEGMLFLWNRDQRVTAHEIQLKGQLFQF